MPPDQMRPLLHPDNSGGVARQHQARIESVSFVFDQEPEALPVSMDLHVDLVGSRMARDVRQGLLDDPERGDLDRGREARRLDAVSKRDGYMGPSGVTPEVPLERRN